MYNQEYHEQRPSYFDGGLASYIVTAILSGLLTILTLGLAYPWATCMMYRWKIEHTVIEGRRLVFKGTGASLFFNWIVWLFLTIITLGIYGFWVFIKLEQWKVKNTFFVD